MTPTTFGRILSAAVLFGAVAPAAAQSPTPAVSVPPVSVILPNYNSVPVGEVAALEGGAFVARANDSSAGFYNPAGLARAEQSSISGTSGAYQLSSVSPDGLTNIQNSFQHIPSQFSVVVNDLLGRQDWAGGFTLTRTNGWNQAVDSVGTWSRPGLASRLRFSTGAQYDAYLGSLGVGYARSDRLRLGATIDGQYTSISRRQSVTTQFVTSTGLSSITVGSLGNLSTTHLRATVGAQYHVTPAIHLGAVLRTPGLGVTSSGQGSIEGLTSLGTTKTALSFFDPEASVEYRLPLEFKLGAAWMGTRAQVEFDLFTYAGTGQYRAVESTEPVAVVVDAGQGGAPQQSQASYLGATVDSRTIVNVAIGGRYQLSPARTWTLHGGYATDRSPVGVDDTGFTKVNLQHLTVGLSGRTNLFLGSVGIRYSAGRSAPLTLGVFPDEDTFQTTFKVSSIGLVYSLALLF